MSLDDTIAAMATPPGEGGLAVVRLSGSEALAVADRVFEPIGRASLKPTAAPTHTLHYGRIVRQGKVVDEVLAGVMRAPRTYTREHVVEISCHGGLLVARQVLEAVLENGARLALPGEFTKRAFLNGRLDLAQAEAVADLIHSRTELALAAAQEQLAGSLSRRVNQVRDGLMNVLAHVEAHIDFPDEDIAPDTREQLLAQLRSAAELMQALLATAHEGQILRQGLRAAIVGRPNVGKSSLLNCLLDHDRAIVSPLPGTTRDTIEETADIRGIPVVLVDTAGLRETGDELESEGIRRSRAALAGAELVLHVLDASAPLTPADDRCLRDTATRQRILVCNKADLPRSADFPSVLGGENLPGRSAGFQPTSAEQHTTPRSAGFQPALCQPETIVAVSCVTGQGLEALKDAIKAAVWSGAVPSGKPQAMISARHQDALRRGQAAARQALEALGAGISLELVALDLRLAVNAVGEIVGKTATEDLLDSIFSRFCIGK
jgi:tRNA modification GTPase